MTPRQPLGGDASGTQLASGETRRGPFTVEQATEEALRGPRHRVRSELFRAVDETIFGAEHPMETAAVGITASYGTEASMVTRYWDVPPEAMRAASALKGYLANQLTVLKFIRHDDGPDLLYEIRMPEGLQPGAVASKLRELGLEYATPELRADGTVKNVLLAEPRAGSQIAPIDAFAEWARSTDIVVSEGTAELLGSDQSRRAAREVFRDVLQGYSGVVGRPGLIREALGLFKGRVQASARGEGGPGSPGQQPRGLGDAGPGGGPPPADGLGGRGAAGAGGAAPPVAPPAEGPPPGRRTPEGWPGRGFSVRVSDREPKFVHSARILGDDAEAFVRSFLDHPVEGPRLEARRRGVLGAARVDELAQRVGLSTSDYLRMARGSIFPAEVQAHLASLIHAHREALAEVSAHHEQALRDGDAGGAAAAEASVGELSHNMARLLMTLEASRSEAGRTLGANRLAKTKAESLAMKALRMVMDETTLPESVQRRLAARIAAAGGDSTAVIEAVREAYLPGWWQRLVEYRVNMLLSSPVTILRNTVGNGLAVATRLTEQIVGLPIDLAYETVYRATHGGRVAADRNSKGVLHVVSRSGNSRYDQSPWDLSLERP